MDALREQVFKKRLEALVNAGHLSQRQSEEFKKLDEFMETADKSSGMLDSYHRSNDAYMHLLERVLEGLTEIREPYADDKYRAFLEEKGAMLPAAFLTPWEMTLSYLDRHIGNEEDVARFYGLF